MNITEDYVSFETAKLLKEKGFNEYCRTYYTNSRIGFHDIYNSPQLIDNKSLFEMGLGLSAPTLQMAMKWLRIKHNIHIEILMTNHSMSERFDIPKYYWVAVGAKTSKWITESTLYSAKQFDTNEEACEAAIKHCLENLIGNKN